MVVIFNFGGQYAHLIARRVRELGIRSELISPHEKIANIKKLKPQAVIFSGSPYSCYDKNAPKANPEIYKLNIPILGICYGHQLMAFQLGGQVLSKRNKQFGKEMLKIKKSKIFEGLKPYQNVWFSHGDQVNKVPEGFKIIAASKNAQVAAMEDPARNFYGIQFHAEVAHTPKGMKIIENFLYKIARCRVDWNLGKVTKIILEKLKEEITDNKVIMAISGGVDSLVAGALLKKAIGKNLYLISIDTGFLRLNEVEEIKNIVSASKLGNLKIINARKSFLDLLKNVTNPEEKRQKIAKHYFSIFEDEAKKIGNLKYLAQGTIYPDRVESASTSKHADKIKSHHNVTLPRGLKLKIIEPLADFYKDEVRKVGIKLGIKKIFLNRHPFPGPGLAIRILGEVTPDRLAILKEADNIFINELKNARIYNKVGQALAALLPVKSVGVMGDARTYSYIIALRSVDTSDFMTADWSKIPQQILERISTRIVNEVRGVNRVVYDITQKPPATIEYE